MNLSNVQGMYCKEAFGGRGKMGQDGTGWEGVGRGRRECSRNTDVMATANNNIHY
jgi:hypothetical protein